MEKDEKRDEGRYNERTYAPVAIRAMSKEEIETFRNVLIKSYKCTGEDIIYSFEKIIDQNDEDRDDCLLLIYKMKCFDMNDSDKFRFRDIFRFKVPIPENIRAKADQMRWAQKRSSRILEQATRMPELPAPMPPIDDTPKRKQLRQIKRPPKAN